MSSTDRYTTYFSDNPHLRGTIRVGGRNIPTWILATLAAALLAGLLAKPGYRAFRKYRVDLNFQAAQAALNAGDWGTARNKARSVLLARPDDFAAFGIWARALSKLDAPDAYLALARLGTDSRATRTERLGAIRMLAGQAPHGLVFGVFASMPQELRRAADFRAAITPLLVRRGEIDFAEKSLREVIQENPPAAARLELLRILCARPSTTRLSEARGIFAGLVASHADAEALDALVLLGDTPGGLAPGPPLPDLPQWVKTQAQAGTRHRLLAMEPELRARPDSAERLVANAITRFLTSDPALLGTWLAKHQRGEQAAALLEEPAKSRPDARLARLRILLDLHRDADVEAALADVPPGTDPVEIELIDARLAWLRNKPIAAQTAMNRAMNRAAFDTTRNRFIEIAQLAGLHQAREAAMDAWVGALRLGWGPLPIYQDMLRVLDALAAAGRTEDLLAIYQTLQRFEPGNADLANNFNYLVLIHGILPPARIVPAQSELVAANPGRHEFQATLMLAELLDGRPSDALALVPGFRGKPRVNPQMCAALEGSARFLLGESDAATALLAMVNWSGFMRQERRVFHELLAPLKSSELPLTEIKCDKAPVEPDESPVWRKTLERLEKDRASDVLPALPAPRILGVGPPDDK